MCEEDKLVIVPSQLLFADIYIIIFIICKFVVHRKSALGKTGNTVK